MATKRNACRGSYEASSVHPDHRAVLPRLRRAQGQLEGVERMIEDQRYCVDILVQLKAVMAAVRGVELEVFERHLKSCVEEAMRSRDPKQVDKKVRELTSLLRRRSRIE